MILSHAYFQDSVVTNPMIALVCSIKAHHVSCPRILMELFLITSQLSFFQEDIIKSIVGNMEFHEMPDFIVTEDVTGVNAGVSYTLSQKFQSYCFMRDVLPCRTLVFMAVMAEISIRRFPWLFHIILYSFLNFG
jgi:hypothetical protein